MIREKHGLESQTDEPSDSALVLLGELLLHFKAQFSLIIKWK